MTHLTDLELVDAVEDGLPAARRGHADGCAACRARIDDLRATLEQAADAAVPDPSPLFWDHFSARVRDGIDAPGAQAGSRLAWLRHDGLAWTVSAVLAVVLIVGAAWRVTAPSPSGPYRTVNHSSTPDPAAATDIEPIGTDADPAWAVVRTVADEVQWDDAVVAGIAAQPDAAERAAKSLSAAERSELVRLLLAEAKRPGV
jgi:hypothetical protein